MEDNIKKILEYAVWAPSGDNSQPWEFEIEKNKLTILYIKNADNIFLNYQNGGTLIAHGCLLENIMIASDIFGVKGIIEVPENNDIKNISAIVTFQLSQTCENDLFDEIKKRHTNRKNFSNEKISNDIKNQLVNSLNSFEDLSFDMVEDESQKELLGIAGANAEIVILENKFLHNALFSDVVWSQRQERKLHRGLYVGSMEFNPVQSILFWLASFWTIMEVAIKIGFPRFIAKEDSVKYSTGSFLGILSTKSQKNIDFINSGRAMQRIWLIASKNNLGFQPIIAMPFLYKMQSEKLLANIEISDEHANIINSSYENIKSITEKKQDKVNILFRLGFAKSVKDRTTRLEVNDKIK